MTRGRQTDQHRRARPAHDRIRPAAHVLVRMGKTEPTTPANHQEGWHTVLRVLVGVAIGYVLGSRAGRERYEQIKRWASAIVDHPAVQSAAGLVRGNVSEVIQGGK